MANCYSCGDSITDLNASAEHIINNSIGGRFKSKGLLCKGCNEEFGDGIDRVLGEQLGRFTDLLGIKRQREKNNIAVPLEGEDGQIKYVGKKLKPHARLTIKLPDLPPIVHYVPEEEFEDFVAKKKAKLSKKYKVQAENFYIEQPTKELFKINNTPQNDEFDLIFGGGGIFPIRH